ncbi:MAG: carboxylating nicotinate-nucleotide diphosphorylase [Gammaproteobacteria bacterium]|nr:carboxylating nicotinate-nucleotide diphosphorylase [Gammaproteobacteria bacterium]
MKHAANGFLAMSAYFVSSLNDAEIQDHVRRALREDIGGGDVTAALIPEPAQGQASIISREAAVLCGTAWCDAVFRQLDSRVRTEWHAHDADRIAEDQVLCTLRGPARALLTGERTALNFLQTLSGTATLARRYADAVGGLRAQVLDTRKTLPGLRYAQKYAVTCGGCHNHRAGLYDGILIKENHILAAGSITAALHAARASASPGMMIEVEVEAMDGLCEALNAGAGRVLLDNFTLADVRRAVQENRGRARLEASGGVTLENIRSVAETGVDYISVGDLTKNVRAVDMSMRFVLSP